MVIMSDAQRKFYLLDLESLARSLKLTSIDVIKTRDMDIESHWYRSMGAADLYYWKTKDKIIKHQISIFDQVIEWNEFDGVKTGYISEQRDADNSQVIQFDDRLNTHVLHQALDFLNNVDSIEPRMVKQFVSNYQFYNRWQSGELARSLRHLFQRLLKKRRHKGQ